MPNLKDIRRRIKSVQSTQKITQAMKMVAGAKVKRAENRVKAARPYSEELMKVMIRVYEAMKNQAASLTGSRYIELLSPRPVQNVGIIVMTSDRGLCGSYNTNILKQAFRLEKELISRGLTPKFFLVGNKAIQAFTRYSKSTVLGKMGDMTSAPTIYDANQVAERVTQAFLNGEIDAIEVLSTHFISMISYKIRMTQLIPVKGVLPEREHTFLANEDLFNIEMPKTDLPTLQPEMLLEPDPVQALDQLIPMYLSNIIYGLMLEGAASELAARMTAMSNATKNAGEMIDRLTIVYNKARQASITQEILEVVSGAEALN